jgi:hypothetical protein
MSDTSAFGFGQFVPGFDFLQNLSKNAAQAQPASAAGMPGMASWVAPTLSIEDIDKRIQELKSVLFWLEQNTTALKATIQAMEVQKMTLTTLQSMNVNMADLAKAFTAKPPSAPSDASASPSSPSSAAPEATPAAPKPSLFAPKPAAAPTAPEPAQPQPPSAAAAQDTPQASSDATADTAAAKPAVDPMQWWGALTQQFQGIAAAALKDVAADAMKAGVSAKAARAQVAPAKAGKAPAKGMAKGVAKGVAKKPQAAKASAKAPAKSARQAPAKAAGKTAAKAKSAPRKASSK